MILTHLNVWKSPYRIHLNFLQISYKDFSISSLNLNYNISF